MAQRGRIEATRAAAGGTAGVDAPLRQRVRESFLDAFDGIDVEELQGRPVAWTAARAMAPVRLRPSGPLRTEVRRLSAPPARPRRSRLLAMLAVLGTLLAVAGAAVAVVWVLLHP